MPLSVIILMVIKQKQDQPHQQRGRKGQVINVILSYDSWLYLEHEHTCLDSIQDLIEDRQIRSQRRWIQNCSTKADPVEDRSSILLIETFYLNPPQQNYPILPMILVGKDDSSLEQGRGHKKLVLLWSKWENSSYQLIQQYQATSYFHYMNSSVLRILPCLPSEQSRPPPPSPLTNNHPKIPLAFLRVMLVLLLVRAGRADNQCYSITSSISPSNCQICQPLSGMTCKYTASNGTVKSLSTSDCTKTCCNSNLFNNPNQYSLCAPQETYSQSSSNNNQLSLATILIIIFFSIPAGICLLIAICSCLDGRRRTEQAGGEQPYLSAVNLNNFSLQDLGPLYQDRSQSCSICLQGDCNLRTRCGHSYHSQCLYAWIHKKQKCPLCVTREFNPIILYCGQCFKQGRMVQLMDQMREEDELDWRGHVEWKCEICLGNAMDDAISLEFSLAEEKGKEGDPQEGDKSQSKAKVNGEL